MDFSGRIGRVIDNPVEAQSAAMEEGHAWRVRHSPSLSVTAFNIARRSTCLELSEACLFVSFIKKEVFIDHWPVLITVFYSSFWHLSQKRSQRMNILGSHSPLHHSSLNSGKSRGDRIDTFVGFKVRFLSMFGLSAVIHIAQLWFHGRISREESHRIIHQQGQVDGYVFLSAEHEENSRRGFLSLRFFLHHAALSCHAGCFSWESVRVTPRHLC